MKRVHPLVEDRDPPCRSDVSGVSRPAATCILGYSARYNCALGDVRLSGCNDAALWIVWSVERTTGAAGVDLCAVAAIHAHDIKTKVAIPGARVLAVSRKPNPLRERPSAAGGSLCSRPVRICPRFG